MSPSGELSLAGHAPAIGQHPRNFMIDNSGELVFVANRDNNHIVAVSPGFSRQVLLNYTGTEVNGAIGCLCDPDGN
jgi:6-phosphogluconolactonase